MTRTPNRTFLLSAGEASGDTYGAQLIEALREIAPAAKFFGMGGAQMRAAGCDLLVDAHEVAVVGLIEVVKHLPAIRSRFKRILAEAALRKPDAAILIDFPDFNLRLARELHRRSIPVFYFVSPQIWAWRTGRVKQIQKYVRKMIVIFPFEQEFYSRHNVDVTYVGHPLAYLPNPEVSRPGFAQKYGLDPAKEWIALLPGSRKREVRLNLPTMLDGARLLQAKGHQFDYVVPLASTLERSWMQEQVSNAPISVHISENARATMMFSRASIVASGTATVEAALSGTPFVVVYRLSPSTWALGRRLVKLDTFAMPNLIAGRRVVPELIQSGFTAQSVMAELERVIPDGPVRNLMQNELSKIRRQLRDESTAESPAMRAAKHILDALPDGCSRP
jgi:lipid-A-disaccharide synthase